LWQQLQEKDETKLTREPVLIISVATSNPQFQLLYSQARELANFLLEKKGGFKLLASLYSSALPALVNISANGVAELPSCNFYLHASPLRDVVLFAGYSSPIGEEYEFSDVVLSFARKVGIKELVSIGARWAENPISPLETPVVKGYSSDLEGAEWLKNNGVTLLRDETALYFTNVIVALAPRYGLRGTKISVDHGEPKPHPKSIMAMLNILSKKTGITLDTSSLETQSKELTAAIKAGGVIGEEGEDNVQPSGREQRNIYR